MRITTIKTGDTDIQALVGRLYPTLNPASRLLVEAALIKANPHLGEATRFKPDTVIHLPDTGFKPAAQSAGDDPVAGTLAQLDGSLQAHAKEISVRYEAQAQEVEAQERLLKDKAFQTAIKNDAQAMELAQQALIHLRDRKKRIDGERRDRQALLEQIAKDIGALVR